MRVMTSVLYRPTDLLPVCPVVESVIARRKSLLAQMHAAHQKAQLQWQRAVAQQQKERRYQMLAQAVEQQRHPAEARYEEQRRAVEERRLAAKRPLAEPEFRTDAARRQVPAFERLLQDRNRVLATQRRRVEETSNAHGSAAFVAAVQEALAASVYQDGLRQASAGGWRI